MEWIVEAETLSDFVDHERYTISEKPLIRCKDCKHFYENRWCSRYLKAFMPDDYCSYAERRTMAREEATDVIRWMLVNWVDSEDKHKALQLAITALEQPERKTGRWIETEGLDEEIRCLMCTNHMRSDRGCDGHCQYDEHVYKKIMSALERRMMEVEHETDNRKE